MPRDGPHPHALFSLVPLNYRAQGILTYRENGRFVSSFPHKDNPTVKLQGLDIGFHIGSTSRYTLATLGREGDIKLDAPDRSLNNSTKLFGPITMPFEPGRPRRRVVVDQNINLYFGIGGVACDLYQFQIYWHPYDKRMVSQCAYNRVDNPHHARTVANEPPTTVSSFPLTRIHATGSRERIRYSIRVRLGSGAYGEVWKVANIDTGEQLAVKRVARPDIRSPEYLVLKREVETLSRISHRNMVEYRAAQFADDEHLEIFMELKSGSVQYLIQWHQLFTKEPAPAASLLFQMLQALDYLANEDIIHRDVKPENILYTPLSDGQFLYQFADFGVANMAPVAQTRAGTDMYMALELWQSPNRPQTTKMDIWSLFVTIAYAVDAAGFRGKPQKTPEQRIKAAWEAAKGEWLRNLRDMAIEDPNYRSTAGDMLDKLFDGKGRTTSRNRAL